MATVTQVGRFKLGWGESLVWDETRERLYFVDCATSRVHWLDRGAEEPEALALPSTPTGLVPTEDGRLIVVVDDGLAIVDVDSSRWELIFPYPPELGGRCNDAAADGAGRLITGKLNLGGEPGSAWIVERDGSWRQIDSDISNTNGPTVGSVDGVTTLVIGDTAAHYYAYPYDAERGEPGERRVFGDVSAIEGHPDGATFDSDGRLWCALVGGGQVACFTSAGVERAVPLPTANPTDVAFGGPELDRLYVVSVAGERELDGALLAVDGLGVTGRVEPRFAR